MIDQFTKSRLEKLTADEGGAFQNVSVPKALLKRLLDLLETPPPVCPHCETHEAFDVVARESIPSRLNPLAAAAAVNLQKAGAAS